MQQKIEVNFSSLDNEVTPDSTVVSSVDNVDSTDIVVNTSLVEKPQSLDAAIALLSCCTQGQYNELCKKFIETFNLPVEQLPSYYMMTKIDLILFPVNLTANTNNNNSFLYNMSANIDSTS